jgi:hypothetical protein
MLLCYNVMQKKKDGRVFDNEIGADVFCSMPINFPVIP